MASSFTTNKDIEKPGNGDYVDTWNVPLNGDMNVVDYALGSTIVFNATAGSQTLGSYNHTTKVLDTYSYIPLIINVTGAISANVIYTIPSGVGGQWIIRNATTDSTGGPWTVTFASGGGGTSQVITRLQNTVIYSDGTNIRLASDVTPVFPSGTVTMFVQTTAPTGWTKSTTHDNKALRVVSGTAGSGGTTGFTSVFTSRTITTANMPSHTHGVTDPGHSHTTTQSYVSNDPTGPFDANASGSPNNKFLDAVNSSTTGISIQNAGSGTAMDFAVQYVDVIIATKD